MIPSPSRVPITHRSWFPQNVQTSTRSAVSLRPIERLLQWLQIASVTDFLSRRIDPFLFERVDSNGLRPRCACPSRTASRRLD